LTTALAGSLRAGQLGPLGRLGVDIIGIRGAVCRDGDRRGIIDAALVRDFMARARLAVAA
jgi:uncharacterized protein (UPF0264 family)